jgi:hypothetical protein
MIFSLGRVLFFFHLNPESQCFSQAFKLFYNARYYAQGRFSGPFESIAGNKFV